MEIVPTEDHIEKSYVFDCMDVMMKTYRCQTCGKLRHCCNICGRKIDSHFWMDDRSVARHVLSNHWTIVDGYCTDVYLYSRRLNMNRELGRIMILEFKKVSKMICFLMCDYEIMQEEILKLDLRPFDRSEEHGDITRELLMKYVNICIFCGEKYEHMPPDDVIKNHITNTCPDVPKITK